MAIQQYITISLSIVGDGSTSAFTYGLNKLMVASVEVGTFLNMDTVPSGASFHNDGSSPINATATVDAFGNLTITFSSPPANGQQITFYCDLFYAGSGSLSGINATWNSSTTSNTALTVTLSGATTVLVPLVVSGTITGGVISFQASVDNTNWFTVQGSIPASFQPIAAWTLTAGTTAVVFDVAGYVYFRAILNPVITSTGNVVVTINTLSVNATSLTSAGAIATYSTTAPTASSGSGVPMQAAPNGNLVVQEFRRGQVVAKATTISSSGATSILPAQGAGVFADITDLCISVASSSTAAALTMTLSDGTASYIFDMNVDNAVGAQFTNLDFDPPLPATTANTAWTLNTGSTTTTHVTVVAVKQTANF